MPQTIAARTRRVYDTLANVYPVSTFFFHSRAHELALRGAAIQDGMRVLELATGSGEMFRRLVEVNPHGHTFGLDLSPKMAARTQANVQREFPGVKAHCGAVDVRHMPFQDECFDVVVCCFLFELLATEDIQSTLHEVSRVLRPGGTFSLALIGQNVELFNRVYRVAGSLVPAFWGRQVEQRMPEMMEEAGLRMEQNHFVRQTFYPSRVVVAKRSCEV